MSSQSLIPSRRNEISSQDDDWPLISMEEFISTEERHNFSWDPPDNNTTQLSNPKHKRFIDKGFIYTPLPERDHLGQSSRANVYKVVPPKHLYESGKYRRPLALKVLNCMAGGHILSLKEAREEVETMKDVVHPHIVAYIASYEMEQIVVRGVEDQLKKRNLGIVMYPPGQENLAQYIKPISKELFNIENGESTELKLWMQERTFHLYRFFGCIAQAISYLQGTAVRIRHKDIKPENIVIDKFESPILTDFGIAKRFKLGTSEETEDYTAKTAKYACPEAMNETKRDFRSDVFSLGCVFLEMITIILGKSLESLHDYRCHDNPNKELDYSETIKETNAWIEDLNSATNSYIGDFRPELPSDVDQASFDEKVRTEPLKVLSVIIHMMRENRIDRPQAYELWEKFQGLYLQKQCIPCRKQHEKRIQSNQQGEVSMPAAQPPPSQDVVDSTSQAGEPSNVMPPEETIVQNMPSNEVPATPQPTLPEPDREPEPPRDDGTRDSSVESANTKPTSSRRKKNVIYYDIGEPDAARALVLSGDDERVRVLPTKRIQIKPFHFVVPIPAEGNEVPPLKLYKYGWSVFWRVVLRRNKDIYVPSTAPSELVQSKG